MSVLLACYLFHCLRSQSLCRKEPGYKEMNNNLNECFIVSGSSPMFQAYLPSPLSFPGPFHAGVLPGATLVDLTFILYKLPA